MAAPAHAMLATKRVCSIMHAIGRVFLPSQKLQENGAEAMHAQAVPKLRLFPAYQVVDLLVCGLGDVQPVYGDAAERCVVQYHLYRSRRKRRGRGRAFEMMRNLRSTSEQSHIFLVYGRHDMTSERNSRVTALHYE